MLQPFDIPISSLPWVKSRSLAHPADNSLPWVLPSLAHVLELFGGPDRRFHTRTQKGCGSPFSMRSHLWGGVCWSLLFAEAWWSWQDPFCLMPKEFQEKLSKMEEKALSSALANTNLDLFLIELHEMITVALSSFQPQDE